MRATLIDRLQREFGPPSPDRAFLWTLDRRTGPGLPIHVVVTRGPMASETVRVSLYDPSQAEGLVHMDLRTPADIDALVSRIRAALCGGEVIG